jgi:hypothetical protein
MDSTVRLYNKAIKEYDRELYAHRSEEGVISILRCNKRFVLYDLDGQDLHVLIDSPEFIFALTDNWSTTGQPRLWGSDRVLARLREIDSWAKKDFLEEIDEQNEKVDQSKARHLRNEMEAMFSDGRRQFAKATDGILTHSLDKTEKNRRKRDANRECKQRLK